MQDSGDTLANRRKPIPLIDNPPIKPIHHRYSGRTFAQEIPSMDVLNRVFEAARWAPSCFNAQPWKFVAAIHPSQLYNDLHQTLMEGNRIWAHRAPVIIAACVIDYSAPKGEKNAYAEHDLGLAIGQMSVQVSVEGLNMHQLGGFHQDPAQALVQSIDNRLRVKTMIVLGYPDAQQELDEPFASREAAAQERKPLSEVVHIES